MFLMAASFQGEVRMSMPTPEKEIAARAQSEVDRLTGELRTIDSRRKALRIELKRWKQLLKLATNERRGRRGRLPAADRVSNKTELTSGRERSSVVASRH
jgi:hypothetical protein